MSPSVQQKKFSAYQLIQAGKFHEARSLLDKLSKVEKNDYEIFYQLGAVNGQLGNLAEAEKSLIQCIQLNPDFVEAEIALSTVFHFQQDFTSAIERLKNVIQQHNGNYQALYALGNVQKDAGDYLGALDSFEKAVDLAPQWVEARSNLAATLHYLGRVSEAVAQLRKALEIDPSNLDLQRNLAITLVSAGDVKDAGAIIGRVLAIQPENPENYFVQGTILSESQNIDQAIESYQLGLKEQPGNIDAKANLAALFEKVHNTEVAGNLCHEVLSVNPKHVRANLTLAKLDSRADSFNRAIARLESLLESDLGMNDKALTYMQLGKMLDREERFAEAFAAFEAGNSLTARIVNFASDAEIYITNISKIRDWYSSDKVRDWNLLSDDGGVRPPAFIVGFPRSGTTLLDQILSSHSKITTGDEILFINSLIEELPRMLGDLATYPDCLSDLSVRQIAYLRNKYWELFHGHFGGSVNPELFVDKFPMNILHLGFINRVFPDAKIIVALRDPRDACLSAYMQTFSNNQAMNYFLTLESTGELYDATMGLWLNYRDILQIEYLELYYEELTENFESLARRLISFLGLEWEDAVLSYWSSDKIRYLSTPSYQDVSQPVYKRARGRWINYKEQIDAILPALNPYVEIFGYQEH